MRHITIEQQQAPISSCVELVAKCRQSDELGWGGRGGAEAVNTAVKRKEQRLGVESESKITGHAAQLSCA